MNMKEPYPLAVQTFNLTKRFRQTKGFFKKIKITALDRINLQVKKGEIFGILGPNGAGKTTLIKILCTLLIPDDGEAIVNGYSLKDDKKIRSCIGLIVTDERSFHWRASGRNNLEFFGTLQNLTQQELKKRIDEVLSITELTNIADTWFQNYSSGAKQRLSIARGLLHNPQIIFMDEPTKGLDPVVAKKLRHFIKSELVNKQGKAVIIATHNTEEAEELCDRVMIMDKGRIAACGETSQLQAEEGSLYNLFAKVITGKS